MSNTQELKELVNSFAESRKQAEKIVNKAVEDSQKAREDAKAEPDQYE